ncbi:MAG: glycosyltransferase, partial [Halodesulfurarchaeum sp.]
VAVDEGALAETVDDGETGYHFDQGDIDGFRAAVRMALEEHDTLSETCLDRRESISLDRSISRLIETYERLY